MSGTEPTGGRLLTDEELRKLLDLNDNEHILGDDKMVAEAQDKKTEPLVRADTCREVGAWLEGEFTPKPYCPFDEIVVAANIKRAISVLRNGLVPGQQEPE